MKCPVRVVPTSDPSRPNGPIESEVFNVEFHSRRSCGPSKERPTLDRKSHTPLARTIGRPPSVGELDRHSVVRRSAVLVGYSGVRRSAVLDVLVEFVRDVHGQCRFIVVLQERRDAVRTHLDR